MRKPKLCIECGEQPKRPRHPRWCGECWLRHQPMPVQVVAADIRRGSLSRDFRATVPEAGWPAGRRWCAGCQTFRSFRDVAAGTSRCRPCMSAAAHEARMQRLYGLPLGEYARLLAAQGGRCAICWKVPRSVRLAVDHNHLTGRNRGLLCKRCNHDLLGAAHHDPRILRRAAEYLEADR